MKQISRFVILDLFCGAGGMSYGMHKNGHFETAVALDFNEKAANTFKQNMPDTKVITGDITDANIQVEVIRQARSRQVNMIIGGPPCQGFSMKGKKLGLADERNYLFREYLKVVEAICPEVFVIENVKSLLNTANGWFRDEILSYIKRLGYKVTYGVLNSKDFGVPQSRERAIFICSKSKVIQLPKPTGHQSLTVRDAISDLSYLESGEGEYETGYITEPETEYQRLMRVGSERLYNHKASKHAKIAVDKLAMIPPEGDKSSLPETLLGKQKFNTTWGRLSWTKPSPTIDTRFDTPSNGTNSHPVLNRAITPREAARLQSFDDRFVFYGNKVSVRTQIGNAVPPLMAKAIADAVWQVYEDDYHFSAESNRHEDSLDEQFKKEHGIFYTDIDLSRNIVNFLGIPSDSSCIDAWCGSGSFIYALQRYAVGADVYGCDFDSKTTDKCRKITSCANIHRIDTLGHDGADVLSRINHPPFDYLVSNPPYAPIGKGVSINGTAEFVKLVNRSGKNLYIAALYRAFEYVKEGGIISVVIPKNFLHIASYRKIREYILREKNVVSIIELGIHFKSVRGEQIVLTLQNSHSENNIIKFYDYNDGNIRPMVEIEQSFFKDEIIVFTCADDIKLYKMFKDSKSYLRLKDACVTPIRRGHSKDSVSVRGKQIRKFGFRDRNLPQKGNQIFIQNIFAAEAGLTASYAGDLQASETVTIVRTQENRTKYILGLLNSRICNYFLIRFLFNNSRLTIHTDGNYLNNIPIPLPTLMDYEVSEVVEKMETVPYMSEEWFALNEDLNRRVYGLYGLPIVAINHIETEMKKISANKWYGTQL